MQNPEKKGKTNCPTASENKKQVNKVVEARKATLTKVIQSNEEAKGLANIVLMNYTADERPEMFDKLVTLVAYDKKKFEEQLTHEAFCNALKFHMLVFAGQIRELLGLDDAVFIDQYPF